MADRSAAEILAVLLQEIERGGDLAALLPEARRVVEREQACVTQRDAVLRRIIGATPANSRVRSERDDE
jgi:hypothetical protein